MSATIVLAKASRRVGGGASPLLPRSGRRRGGKVRGGGGRPRFKNERLKHEYFKKSQIEKHMIGIVKNLWPKQKTWKREVRTYEKLRVQSVQT